jgi:2-methylisocitrate lyase-like PEP mutase family enzyme
MATRGAAAHEGERQLNKEKDMSQTEKATRFAELHVKGTPLLLYNAWDAGSAKAIAEAGAKAIATSSWSVAEAQGYRDGEAIPLGLTEQIFARIAATIDVPLTVDFEGGYSEDDGELTENISRLLDLGAIGINFEDRVVKGSGLYDIERQARRITVIRNAAEQKGVGLFINARTDLFLGQGRDPAQTVGEALERARTYAAAGASGFFIPGLQDDALIGQICDGVALPVNVMVMDGVPLPRRLAKLGVSRISYGPLSYIRAMAAVKQEASWALSSLHVRPREKGEGPEPAAGWAFDK